jgi:hypothetical protein
MAKQWNELENKLCPFCKIELPFIEDYWGATNKRYCSNCRIKAKKESIKRATAKYLSNPDNKAKAATTNALWLDNHKEYVKQRKKDYKHKHPDKTKADRDKHYSNPENVEKKKIQDKIYYKNNKKKIKKYQYNWLRSKPHLKLQARISHMIRLALYNSNSSKNGNRSFDYLDYTAQELKEHLEQHFESWMTWDNWGVYRAGWDDNDQSTWTWQIDHIIPQSRLPYTSMEDDNFKKCWALENLRPLSAKQNVLRGNKEIG